MGHIESKTFKSGNSVAVRLPKEVAFAPDMRVTIERVGDVLTIRPAIDLAAEKRAWLEALDALRALPKPGHIEQREKIEFPEREGL